MRFLVLGGLNEFAIFLHVEGCEIVLLVSAKVAAW
jgi:hypothetical protein